MFLLPFNMWILLIWETNVIFVNSKAFLLVESSETNNKNWEIAEELHKFNRKFRNELKHTDNKINLEINDLFMNI